MAKRFNIPRPQINRPQMEVYTSSHAHSYIWYALPSPLTTFYSLVTAGSVTGLAYFLGDRLATDQGSNWAMIAIAVMTVIGVAAGAVRARREKKREEESGEGFEAALKQSAAGWDASVSDPGEIARLDDLRNNFQKGIDTFREYGRDFYSLPWYVIMGEPGSGKSEAIRRSELRFPDALQDKLQGTGGTYSMHWWFTNHAIILDTAGAMLMQPEAAGRFEEFLNLLRGNRPDCPINGLILTIPTDSLLQDPPSVAEQKAKTISNQLAIIQKALDVRFPIYIMVSKSDRLPGFREYFDAEGQATFERQMMGWSNPDPLGTTFEPDRIAEALDCIAGRLQSRALALLSDPIPSNQGARRLDEVDSIYGFPNVIRSLAPRLRLYLNVIFQTGTWAVKPPFFRGVFFTSALREGAQLDQVLAQALGMPLQQLPPGGIFAREKAVFLRDMFMEKVFPEQGLVTRLVDIGAHLRKRLMTFYGATAALLLFALGFAWIVQHKLSVQLAQEQEQWVAANGSWNNGTLLAMVKRTMTTLAEDGQERPVWVWSGSELVNGQTTRLEHLADLRHRTSEPLSFKWVFWPVWEWRDFLTRREEGFLTVFEASVMKPLIDAARERILWDTAQGATVSADGQLKLARAYEQLLRLETWVYERDKEDAGEPPTQEDWEAFFPPLLEYCLHADEPPGGVPAGALLKRSETGWLAAKASVKDLATLAAEIYSKPPSGRKRVNLAARGWMSEADVPVSQSALAKAAGMIFGETANNAQSNDQQKAELAKQKDDAMARITLAEATLTRMVDDKPDGPRSAIESEGLQPMRQAVDSYEKLMGQEKGVVEVKLGTEDVNRVLASTKAAWQELGGKKAPAGLEVANRRADEFERTRDRGVSAGATRPINNSAWTEARKRLSEYEESFKEAAGTNSGLKGGFFVGKLMQKLDEADNLARSLGGQGSPAAVPAAGVPTAGDTTKISTYLRKFRGSNLSEQVFREYSVSLKRWIDPMLRFPLVDCVAEYDDFGSFERACNALLPLEKDIEGFETQASRFSGGDEYTKVKTLFDNLRPVLDIKRAILGTSMGGGLKFTMDAVTKAEQKQRPLPVSTVPSPTTPSAVPTSPYIPTPTEPVWVGYTNLLIQIGGRKEFDRAPEGESKQFGYNGFDPVKVVLTHTTFEGKSDTTSYTSPFGKWPYLRSMSKPYQRSNSFPISGTKFGITIQSSPTLPVGQWPQRNKIGLEQREPPR